MYRVYEARDKRQDRCSSSSRGNPAKPCNMAISPRAILHAIQNRYDPETNIGVNRGWVSAHTRYSVTLLPRNYYRVVARTAVRWEEENLRLARDNRAMSRAPVSAVALVDSTDNPLDRNFAARGSSIDPSFIAIAFGIARRVAGSGGWGRAREGGSFGRRKRYLRNTSKARREAKRGRAVQYHRCNVAFVLSASHRFFPRPVRSDVVLSIYARCFIPRTFYRCFARFSLHRVNTAGKFEEFRVRKGDFTRTFVTLRTNLLLIRARRARIHRSTFLRA